MPTMNAMTNKPKQTNISERVEEHTRIQTQCFQRVHAVQLTSASMPVHSSCPFGRVRPPLMPVRRPCSVAPQRICAMRALQHHNASTVNSTRTARCRLHAPTGNTSDAAGCRPLAPLLPHGKTRARSRVIGGTALCYFIRDAQQTLP